MSRTMHWSRAILLAFSLLISNIAGVLPRPPRVSGAKVKAESAAQPAPAPKQMSKEQARKAYGRLGVSFEENRGQTDKRVRFLSRHGVQDRIPYAGRDVVRPERACGESGGQCGITRRGAGRAGCAHHAVAQFEVGREGE